MKTRQAMLLLLGLVLAAGSAGAEESTLLGDLKDIESGGYGGPSVRFTQIDGEFSVMSGGEGAWIINHRYVLGGGGFGLANPGTITEADATGDPITGKLEMGYGGGMVGVIIKSDALVHAAVDVLIGGGGMTTSGIAGDDVFFVVEPAAHAMLNVTSFFRFGVGVSYRFTRGAGYGGLEDPDKDPVYGRLDDSALSGPSWGFVAKFGSF